MKTTNIYEIYLPKWFPYASVPTIITPPLCLFSVLFYYSGTNIMQFYFRNINKKSTKSGHICDCQQKFPLLSSRQML